MDRTNPSKERRDGIASERQLDRIRGQTRLLAWPMSGPSRGGALARSRCLLPWSSAPDATMLARTASIEWIVPGTRTFIPAAAGHAVLRAAGGKVLTTT